MSDNTLILGIGNTLLADEGTGIHMLDYLRRHHPELRDITCLDGGTLSFTLAPWIEEADNLIVIDAAELNAVPGTVEVFEEQAKILDAAGSQYGGFVTCFAMLAGCVFLSMVVMLLFKGAEEKNAA